MILDKKRLYNAFTFKNITVQRISLIKLKSPDKSGRLYSRFLSERIRGILIELSFQKH